ncbi:energy transducer TonB [Prevotella sp. KH2C16]|uniref:energy transducer TonB n=1 Tax=Prevotella sp. KH2C16 TaxID=1855325 RepID=UPI0008F2DA63|nr:energy transducer TonB [Prevotella sp. KH2C16]SFG42193.1 TonB family C-terminal domain-containing protein [Prevotella sp. KH2C16]
MNYKLKILAGLLIILIGGGLAFGLLSSRTARRPDAKGGDSVPALALQSLRSAAVDTAGDIKVIKAYYRFLIEDTCAWEEYKEKEHQFLTQTLIDKLAYYDEADALPLFPIMGDLRNFPLRNLKVRALGGEWYQVSLFEERWTTLPVRMVTDRDGRRKIGYAVPFGFNGAVSDSLILPRLIRMQEKQPDALSFLRAFFHSYISLNHTIDLDAPAYRDYLCEKFAAPGVSTTYSGDSTRRCLNWLDDLVDSPRQEAPRYTISPTDRKKWYRVETTDPEYYFSFLLRVVRQKGHYFIAAMGSDPESDPEQGEDDRIIYEMVEEQPSFPGGEHALMEYLMKKVDYPKKEARKGVSGRVVVSFVVNQDGSISDIEIVRHASVRLDAEVIKAVRSMPAWEPGKKNGRPVRSKYTLPVNFKLE